MVVVLCKRTIGRTAALWLWLLFVLPVCAQQNKVYSLKDLSDSLQHFMPVLMQKEALVKSARAGVTEARHAFLPRVMATEELSLASANSLPGAYLPLGAIPSVSGSIRSQNDMQPATGNIASLYGEYELVNFGLRQAKIDNAEAYVGLGQSDYDRELYLLKLRLGRVYFALLKTRYQLSADEQNISRYESLYAVISALTSSGIRAGVDSSLARAELAKSRIGYNQRTGLMNQLMSEVSYLTGIPASQIVIDTSEKKYIPPAPLNNDKDTGITNPLLSYYTNQLSLYASTEKLVKKSYLPKIMLAVGGWGRGSSIAYNDAYKSLGDGLGYQRFNYAAGIAFTYDLFNGVRKKDKLAQTHYQVQASEHALEQQRLSLQNSVVQSDESIRIAEKNLAELPFQLQAASEAYEQKLAQYKAGMINLVDMTNAAFVLYQAQTGYIETLNDWFTANLDRSAATGTLDHFIQTIKR